jgi:glycosyltransferase involved in cell wall biosynthesis
MRRALASAAAIVVATPEAANRIRESLPELATKPIIAIPNGFDAADFATPLVAGRDRAFRIVHTGYLHTEMGRWFRRMSLSHRLLGGGVKGVDILSRSHIYLLEAIERLIAEDPSLASVIEVHLAGALSNADHEVAGRRSFVRTHGYVSHAESIALIRSADLLFLPMQNLPSGVRATIVPGKTYEYLAAGRPILAAVPEGDARDLLASTGNSYLCSPDSTAEIASAIAAELARWRLRAPIPPTSAELLERYERRQVTSELAATFDLVLGPKPAVTLAGATGATA